MSQTLVSQRLVNATNILFHLLDLQPYALVLPMDCKTASRNKRKIMQKILANNRPQSTKGDDKNAISGNDKANGTVESAVDGASTADYKDNTSEDNFPNSNMKIGTVQTRKKTITERVDTEDTSEHLAMTLDYSIPVNDINSPFAPVNRIVDRLDSEEMKGCIIMLAPRDGSSVGVTPLAGGIIEIYDEHERSIQAIWLNRSLEQRVDTQILLKTLVLRIFAHAYQINLPDRRSTKSNKLVSIYQSMLVAFPRECIAFIEKEMLLSKHYEAAGFNEPHNDNPKVPCRCHKVAAEASELFYGISESRFNNLYTSLYETVLFDSIGKMAPIMQMYPAGSVNNAEKIDQITKAVREIERSLREPNGSKKARKDVHRFQRRFTSLLGQPPSISHSTDSTYEHLGSVEVRARDRYRCFSTGENHYNMERIRNIGISAHIDSGKTTMSERILFYSGRIAAIHEVRGNDGVGAKMDSMDLERERGITIQSAVTNFRWSVNRTSTGATIDYMVNIIDTPGHVDFTIEVERALRVLDGAILLCCSVAGVQSQTLTVNMQMDRYSIPRIVFLNKMDRDGADPDRVMEMIRQKLNIEVLQLQVPIGIANRFEGLVDVLENCAYYFEGHNGHMVVKKDVPEEYKDLALSKKAAIIERLADLDDEFAEEYLENSYTIDSLRAAIRRCCLSHKAYPLLMGSAKGNKGVQLAIDAVCHYLPSPSDVEQHGYITDDETAVLDGGHKQPLVAYAFKIQDSPMGQLTFLRLYQGMLRRGQQLFMVEEGKKHSTKKLFKMHASDTEDVPEAYSGEIVAISGLKCNSGVTFTDGRIQMTMAPIFVPEPVVSLALKKVNTSDMARLSKALNRFKREDPTFRIAVDEESKETVMSGMGELHLGIYVERMKREYNLTVETGPPIVNYRESVTRRVEFSYTHKRQSGGAGQYGKIIGYIEPIGEDANKHLNVEFVNNLVGNDIPPNYVPHIESGFRECCKKGLLCGRQVVNARIVVHDGQSHEVDSSDIAFKLAAKGAFEECYMDTNPIILEPVMQVEVVAPHEFQAAVLSTITKRKGLVTDTSTYGTNVILQAQVALRNMFGYITDLRAATKGQGEFSMEFKLYQPMNAADQEACAKEYQESLKN
ncbi:translation elongation factor [Babesia ovis]|uniref:Elongation factor G, mitochondrial n=1 Tax=Babesia ovis TaxID=5869 RepID=A0A9W5T839_BABOV|nr:translation elongation factor [Babesia ovis]